MASSEAPEQTPEANWEILRPTESDRQRTETDDQGWGRPTQVDAAEPKATTEAPEVADDEAARRNEAEVDADGWGRAARQPIVEDARVDRATLREAMIDGDEGEPAEDVMAPELAEAPPADRVATARMAVEDAYADAVEPVAFEEMARRAIREAQPEPARSPEVSDRSEGSPESPELPLPIGDEDARLAEHDFTAEEITPIRGSHANGAYEVDSPTGDRQVYKPASEEAPLGIDIEAGSYWKHEVAAYQVDQLLGFDLVPPTAAVDGPAGVGSLQEWSPEYTRQVEEYTFRDQQMMGVLDYVLGSSDRHPQNYLTQNDGRPSAIDNGLSLPVADHDGMYSEFADSVLHKPLDRSIVEKVNEVDDTRFVNTLRQCGIAESAIDRALNRLHECQTGQIDGTAWDGPIFGRDQKRLR